MNKKYVFLLIIFIILIAISIFFYFNKPNSTSNNQNYTSNFTSSEQSSSVNEISTENNTSITEENSSPIVEEEIASFATKLISKDSARINNISITCQILNDSIVNSGEIFSFCSTVGKATPDKGYLEADVFDENGNKKKGLGGGNCQISTTLYNAVLLVPNLKIIERHEHSNYVPYIQEGKDAAVAYGSLDFKFQNNTGYNIKIKAEPSSEFIGIRLLKI